MREPRHEQLLRQAERELRRRLIGWTAAAFTTGLSLGIAFGIVIAVTWIVR